MQTNRNRNLLRVANRRVLAALTATALFGGGAIAQHVVEGAPYGKPSQCAPGGPATLGLYLTQPAAGRAILRLEGGTPHAPALVVFGAATAERGLPGGGTQLVGSFVGAASGAFDEHGVFVHVLAGARFADGDRLFAQGAQPMGRGTGTELSGGLQLRRRPVECAPPRPGPKPPEKILVEEFSDFLRQGHLEAALDLALNSKDDALTLEIDGGLQVPVYAAITVGGKAKFKASIQRGENSAGATVYDIAIGADIAAAAGVGVGFAGVEASSGAGMEVIWRYDSTHELARAIRSMAILQAVGDRIEAACIAVDLQLEQIDRAINSARHATDRLRGAARSRLPWRNNPLVKKLQRRQDELRRQRRDLADRARKNVEWLISWVADARIFLIAHLHGYETRQTLAIEGSVSLPVSGANLGAGISEEIEQQLVVRAERVPESGALAFERKCILTRTFKAQAGCTFGAQVAAKRVVELNTRLQMGKDGLHTAESGTTVKIILDGKLLGALGQLVAAKAGVGGEVTLELRLADLLGYSKDAIAILLGDDEHKAAELLLAFPIKFCVRGRYEAGIAVGIGVDIDGAFKANLGASAMMTDWGAGFTYEGGSGSQGDRGETVPHLLVEALRGAVVKSDDAGMRSRLTEVSGEVERVMAR